MDHEAQQPEEEEDGLKGIAMAEVDREGGSVPPKSLRVAPLWCGELWSAARRTVTSASWPNGIREQSEPAVGQGGLVPRPGNRGRPPKRGPPRQDQEALPAVQELQGPGQPTSSAHRVGPRGQCGGRAAPTMVLV